MRWPALVLVGGLCACAAHADEVVLKSGRRISGVVVEQTATTVVLDVGAGLVGFPRGSVARVVEGTSSLTRYRERAAALGADDAAGWLALGLWARDNDLQTPAREAFERVIAIDPANAAAHRGLGHELVDGAWLSGDAAQRARGLVPFEGEWVTPAEQAARLAEREADRRDRRERAAADARAAEAEARAREAEARARQAEDQARVQGGIPIGGVWGWGAAPCVGSDCRGDRRDGRPGGDRGDRGDRHGDGKGRPQPTPQPTPRPLPPCSGALATNCQGS
ncbi:MAG: hypothetical protein KJ067_15635 [Vicinamibacteria bacterium]|nr:hypothetical protein [Vicinamibacteria bacterium]